MPGYIWRLFNDEFEEEMRANAQQVVKIMMEDARAFYARYSTDSDQSADIAGAQDD